MSTYVAFLRAINVGGRSMVSMADLSATFRTAGGDRVRTYIASGNVLFDAPAAEANRIVERVQGRLARTMKNEPAIMLRTLREVEALVKSAPFKAFANDRHAKTYVAFLLKAPRPCPSCPFLHEKEALEVIAIEGREALVVSRPKKSGFYGFPNNFIEDALGVDATTRNWSTVTKVVEFAARE